MIVCWTGYYFSHSTIIQAQAAIQAEEAARFAEELDGNPMLVRVIAARDLRAADSGMINCMTAVASDLISL